MKMAMAVLTGIYLFSGAEPEPPFLGPRRLLLCLLVIQNMVTSRNHDRISGIRPDILLNARYPDMNLVPNLDSYLIYAQRPDILLISYMVHPNFNY